MNRVITIFLGMSLFAACTHQTKDKSVLQSVDPYIGSDGHGHVFVGASIPHGSVQLGPENYYRGWDWCSGYNYNDTIIKGFTHTHLSGTGCAELGDLLLMPAIGEINTIDGSAEDALSGFASPFSRKSEVVEPGFYSVMLNRYNIDVELTSTPRTGFHKYTFKEPDNAHLVIDLVHGIYDSTRTASLFAKSDTVILGSRISDGWSIDQRLYFAMVFSKPHQKLTLYSDTIQLEGKAAKDPKLKGVAGFNIAPGENLMVKVGLSPVSPENALQNVMIENPGWDFEKVKKSAAKTWENELNKIDIDADPSVKRIFYTSFYHTMFFPSLYNDANGEFLGADKKIYRNTKSDNYTTFSLWDTYRAAHPLFTLTDVDRVADYINTMLALYQQEGKLPEWHLMGHDNRVMIGYNAVPVIADAFFKGIEGFDKNLAYEAMVTTAMRDDRGVQYLKEFGYIPSDMESESVAKSLEYAIYDWSIAQMAKKLGEENDYTYFLNRSKSYLKYFDPKDRFFKGKLANGSFRLNFNPIESSHRNDEFCEGNGWQYLWLVPHDVEGLINLLGGRDQFVQKLDSLFLIEEDMGEGASVDISGLIGMYAHGNEPSHHISYLYAYAGEQWKTAEKVRQIMDEMYSDKPDGLCGNEDCGQMSAWYIWSALGMYPVNPSNGAYVFGSPVVNEATIHLPDNKHFSIVAHNNSSDNIYIQSVLLNGEDYPKSYITHKDILAGGKLEFIMGETPNKSFGANVEDMPKSIIY